MASASLVQLSVATPWSFHWGASRLEALVARAAERGIAALGMADRNGMWGALPFQQACESAGVRPLLGARLQVEGAAAQVLALDRAGYAAACRLVTRAQFEHRDEEAPGGVVSERLAGWLAEEAGGGLALLSRQKALLKRIAEERGPANLFVGVAPGWRGAADLDLAAELDLPAVALPAVVFADREDWERHRLLAAIGANTNVSRIEEAALAPREAWLKGGEALRADYAHAPECLGRAAELAERARFRIPCDRKLLPRSPLGGDSAMEHLARLCERGVQRRRVPDEPRYRSQLRRELAVIAQQGMADYFLIVADITRYARGAGMACCGRGSAANSLVSYLLGCTQVDPIRHGLYFERFMHAGRRDYPDIDLDFAWDERDEVRDYVFRRFGRERVAMIGTHVTFATRGAVRELAKAMGVPAAEIGHVTRALPRPYEGGFDLEGIRSHPRAARLPLEAEPWCTILEQASTLNEFPRHLGIHSGGLVIGPGPLTDHLPLQHAAKETEEGRIVITQWDMHPVEDAGLLKIDLLGNRGLAVIRDGVEAVLENRGVTVDFSRIDPVADEATCEALARGDTMGCFYIESPSMRSLLQKLRCRTFDVLVAASSIIRPGISSSGMMQAYIERQHYARTRGAHDPAWYLHPALKELLSETFGVMAYQEDVLKVAERVAGMSTAEADDLRRAMSHKRAYRRIATYGVQFVRGAVRRGLDEEQARELWRQIESFSGYSFCKAHSASYALVSYESAYLRAHYPAEFMAAVLRNYGGYYSTFAYLAEARRMGLGLKLPGLNTSAANFRGWTGTVQVGLAQVRGLGDETLRRILKERETHGLFRGLEDFWRRVRPAPKDLDALLRAGALDELPDGMTRPERLRYAALLARHRSPRDGAQGQLFFDALFRRPPAAPEYSPERLLEQEEEALGWLVSVHPLARYHEQIHGLGTIPARDLPAHAGERVRLVGWQVTQKSSSTRAGQPMAFITFEDTTALYETVLFPDAYRRLAPWVLTHGPYLLEGFVQSEYGAVCVQVHDLQLLRGEPALERER